MAELITEFDFTTPGDWTPSDDAELSGGVLTVEDPFVAQLMTSKNWAPEMLYLDDEATPQNGVIHRVLNGEATPSDLYTVDGAWSVWVKSTSALGAGNMLTFLLRYVPPNDYLWAMMHHVGGTTKYAKLFQDSGLESCREELWGQDWVAGEWRKMILWYDGGSVRFMMGAYRDVWHRHVDLTSAGTVGIQVFDSSQRFRVGANDGQPANPSEKPCPYFCHTRSGACELKTTSAHTFVAGTTALHSLVVHSRSVATPTHETLSGVLGGDVSRVSLQYALDTGSGFGAWTDPPADGDLSGVSVSGGDKIIVRVDDGSGAGLGNAYDPRYKPIVDRILLGSTAAVTGEARYGMRRDGLQGGPRRGEGEQNV